MAKILVVKVEYEDDLRKITATSVKTERGKLFAFDGENPVAEFTLDKVEHWSLEDSDSVRAANAF